MSDYRKMRMLAQSGYSYTMGAFLTREKDAGIPLSHFKSRAFAARRPDADRQTMPFGNPISGGRDDSSQVLKPRQHNGIARAAVRGDEKGPGLRPALNRILPRFSAISNYANSVAGTILIFVRWV
jgi:hypothetical protein